MTYVSENPTDLTSLTPSLFLKDVEEVGIPDLDLVEASDLNQRLRYRQNLKKILTERFRTEYLGQLQLHTNKSKPYELNIGEVVLIGGDGMKRLNWPMARIVDLIKGKDGNVRLLRLKTKNGEIIRPVQRIFPLEIKSNSEEEKIIKEQLQQVSPEDDSKLVPTEETVPNVKCTRRGRPIHIPKKFQD